MANSLFMDGNAVSGEQVVAAGPTATRLIPTTGAAANDEGGIFWNRCVIVAKAGNAATIQVGGSDVDGSTNDGLSATDGTNDSLEIVAVSRTHFDASDIWIFGSAGEGVDFYLFK